MSMPDAGRRSSVYVGTGSVREFSFAFKVFAKEQVAVYRLRDGAKQEELVPATEYSVSLEETGGTVAFTTAPTTGDKIVIVSAIDYTQGLGLNDFGAFNPSDLTGAWDKNTALIQQVLDKAERSVQMPNTSSENPAAFTKSLFDARDEAVAAANAAGGSASAAGSSASAAAGAASAAAGSASDAASSASAAETAKTGAERAKSAAESAKTAAESAAASASTSAKVAGDAATQAKEAQKDATAQAAEAKRQANLAAETVKTASFSIRYYGKAVTPGGQVPVASLNPSTNTKAGDKILDVVGHLFNIESISGATATVGTKLANLVGPQGPQGIQGVVGPKGDKGDRGPQGQKGDTGEQGPQGIQGIQGPVGPKGNTGPQGPVGAKGDTGLQGPKGEKGSTGEKGATGATFTPSVSAAGVISWTNDGGKTNPAPVSIKGPKGDKGATGEQGPKGDQGDTGKQGPKGDKGDPGERGPKGDTGLKGPQGEKGDTGAGLTILGEYDTLEALKQDHPAGAPGDAYLITGDVWYWSEKESGWANAGALQGPQGPQGIRGEKGEQGIQGPKGDQGEKGGTGPQGPKGNTGDTGPKGADGADGARGPQGPRGYHFTPAVDASGNLSWTNDGGLINPGPVNIKGPKGDRGGQGVQGPKGDTGAQGPQGLQGKKGDTGAQGPQGEQGPKGEQGPQGKPGNDGAQGPKGDAGVTPAITVKATVGTSTGTPTVNVAKSGTTNAPIFTMSFNGLKGQTGPKGADGKNGVDGKPGTTLFSGLTGVPNNVKNAVSYTAQTLTEAQKAQARENIGAGGGLPMGHLFAWPFPTPPDGCIQCDGAAYSRTLYADFFAYANSKSWVKTEAEWNKIASANGGFCPYYSDGDGSTTFRTPKFAPFMQIAIASGSVGTYHRAGLPNIKGDLPVGEKSNIEDLVLSGAFYQDGTNTHRGLASDADNRQGHFDASRSNPIYGRSSTVQPESNEWMICVVVAGTATNIGSVDVANVLTAVAQVQAQVGAIPTPGAYITKTWRNGSNWYRKWSDGFIEQGGLYTNTEGATVTLTLNTAFGSANYAFYRSPQWAGSQLSGTYYCMGYLSKAASSVQFRTDPPAYYAKMDWYACGY